jgi:hypothetical protein
MALHLLHFFTLQRKASGYESARCFLLHPDAASDLKIGFVLDGKGQPVTDPELLNGACLVDRFTLRETSVFVAIGLDRPEGQPLPPLVRYGWTYLWPDKTPAHESRATLEWAQPQAAFPPAEDPEAAAPQLGLEYTPEPPKNEPAEKQQDWQALGHTPRFEGTAGEPGPVLRLVATPDAPAPPSEAEIDLVLERKEHWPLEIVLHLDEPDRTATNRVNDRIVMRPDAGSQHRRIWRVRMAREKVYRLTFRVANPTAPSRNNRVEFDLRAALVEAADPRPLSGCMIDGQVAVTLRLPESAGDQDAPESSSGVAPESPPASGGRQPIWRRKTTAPSSHLTVIALDIGSSTIAAARFDRIDGKDRVEMLRIGEIVDTDIGDRGRVDRDNPFLVPSGIWLAASDEDTGAGALTDPLDPAMRTRTVAGMTGHNANEVAPFLEKTGRAMVLGLPALSEQLADAREQAFDPSRPEGPVQLPDLAVVVVDPKALVCRHRHLACRYGEDGRAWIAFNPNAADGQEAVPTEYLFAELLASVLRNYLPNLRAETTGDRLGSDWYWPDLPGVSGDLVIALSHPASIGTRAIERYRAGAERAIEAVWPNDRRSRNVRVELVPEALAISVVIRDAMFRTWPADETVSGPRSAPPAEAPGPSTFIVVDVGNGTTDVLGYRMEPLSGSISPVASFAVPVAGAAFHLWMAQAIRESWIANDGDRDVLPAGLEARIDEALRARMPGDTVLFIKIAAGQATGREDAQRARLREQMVERQIDAPRGSCLFATISGETGNAIWACIPDNRVGDLPVYGPALRRYAALVLGPMLRIAEKEARGMGETGRPVRMILSGRGGLTPGVAEALDRALGQAVGNAVPGAAAPQGARLQSMRLSEIVTDPSVSSPDAIAAMKTAVARGTAAVAAERHRLHSAGSPAAPRECYALVLGKVQTGQSAPTFIRVVEIRDVPAAIDANAIFAAANTGLEYWLARRLPGLRMGDLFHLAPAQAGDADVESEHLTDIERACIRPFDTPEARIHFPCMIDWDSASQITVTSTAGARTTLPFDLARDGSYL